MTVSLVTKRLMLHKHSNTTQEYFAMQQLRDGLKPFSDHLVTCCEFAAHRAYSRRPSAVWKLWQIDWRHLRCVQLMPAYCLLFACQTACFDRQRYMLSDSQLPAEWMITSGLRTLGAGAPFWPSGRQRAAATVASGRSSGTFSGCSGAVPRCPRLQHHGTCGTSWRQCSGGL